MANPQIAAAKHPNYRMSFWLFTVMAILLVVLHFLNADFTLENEVYIFLNLGAIPVLVLYAIWPRGLVGTFGSDVKVAFSQAAIYGVLMSIFLYLFFTFVNENLFANRQEAIIETKLAEMAVPNRQEITDQVQSFFSVRNFSLLAMVAYLLISIFYTLLFSALKRLVIRPRSA